MAVQEATEVGRHCHKHLLLHTLSSSAHEAIPAAKLATNRKYAQCADLPQSHFFKPIALETLGSMNSSTVSFFSDLGCRNSNVSGDIRESSYLFQHIAVTIQWFKSVLFCDSFLPRDNFDFQLVFNFLCF